jgi:hypothetical protein
MKRPNTKAVVHKDGMTGYSGTPLPKKLGVKPSHVVGLIDAPADFIQTLGECPADVTFIKSSSKPRNLTICFLKSRQQLMRRLSDALEAAAHGPVWFAWPKKASGVVTDLSEQLIRDTGLDNGLVDYKICAIDKTWSGLLFCERNRKKQKK